MANRASNNLILAVSRGNVDRVKELIAGHEPSHFEQCSNGYDLLCAAFQKKHRAIAKLLLKSGCAVNCEKKPATNTPLHFAVRKKDTEMVSMLLNKGADVNAKNHSGKTPLHLTAKNKNLTIAKMLLNRNADAHVSDKSGKFPIYYAIAGGNGKMTELLLQCSSDVNMTLPEGDSPLHVAVNFKQAKIVKQLLNHGASVECRSVDDEYTPLHLAVIRDNKEIVKLLLDKGADVNDTSKNRMTPLHLAARSKHKLKLEVELEPEPDLVAGDGNISLQNIASEIPLHCDSENETITRMLFNAGARLSAKNKDGETALDLAIANKDEGVAAILLEVGAAAGYEKVEDLSPLHIAAMHGFPAIIANLLDKFVDVECTNENGQTALHLASKYGHSRIVEKLLDYGADVNATCDKGILSIDYTTASIYENDDELCEFDFDFDIHFSPFRAKYLSLCCRARRNDNIIYLIERHNVMLISLNRYVNKKYLDSFEVDNKYEYFRCDCEEEVELMKSVKIGKTNISYYDLMAKSTDQMAILCRNKRIVNALKSFNCKEKFAIYHKMIYYHWKRGQNRGNLLSSSLKSFDTLSGFALPENVLLDILIRLSNEDLKNLTEAGNEKDRVRTVDKSILKN